MRTRAFWFVAVAGALGIPLAVSVLDVGLAPPSGAWHILFWPVDVLLWATGPGAALSNGQFEWTPVQDLAVLLGIGCTWFFWVLTLRFVVRNLFSHKSIDVETL
jgi:hypothetical protein